MTKYAGLMISILLALPIFACFIINFSWMEISFFKNTFISNVKRDSIEFIAFYIIFISGSHFGIALSSPVKKAVLMILLSSIPFVMSLLILKHDLQYNAILLSFLLIGIHIIERLYELSGTFPKWLMNTRMILNIIIIIMLIVVAF